MPSSSSAPMPSGPLHSGRPLVNSWSVLHLPSQLCSRLRQVRFGPTLTYARRNRSRRKVNHTHSNTVIEIMTVIAAQLAGHNHCIRTNSTGNNVRACTYCHSSITLKCMLRSVPSTTYSSSSSAHSCSSSENPAAAKILQSAEPRMRFAISRCIRSYVPSYAQCAAAMVITQHHLQRQQDQH